MDKIIMQVCKTITTTISFLLFSAFFLNGVVAHAQQEGSEEALEQVRRLIELEEQRRDQNQRAIEDSQRTHTNIPVDEIAPDELNLSGDQCFHVSHVKVEGVTLFGPDKVEHLYTDMVGTCVGIGEINTLIKRLTRLYIDAGYVTSRAYIPPQDLGSGRLVIKVVEGYVESLRIKGASEHLLATALPGLQGKPLNLRDIEQGLDQINRLYSTQATIEFIPGQAVGASVVLISVREHKPLSARLGYNNSGQEATGENKLSINISYDNLLNLNDFLYLNYQGNARNEPGQKSTSSSMHYSLPYGYWSYSLNLSRFEYLNRIEGNVTAFDSSGASDVYQISAERLLMRDQVNKLSLDTILKQQSNENFIDGLLLETSSVDRITLAWTLEHELFLPRGKTLISTLGYERGLDSSGAGADVGEHEGPKEDFDLFTASVRLSGNNQWLGSIWRWHTELNGQYSDDVLYSGESFSIGSQYTVRGYKEVGLSGDSGVYWHNQLSVLSYPSHWLPRLSVEPFLGLDTGYVSGEDTLSGWVSGININGNNFSTSLVYSEPMGAPDTLHPKGEAVYLSLSLNRRW